MARTFLPAALAAVLLSGCAAPASTTPGAEFAGEWGGEHIGLNLDRAGGRLDYDCAAGMIDGPLRLDADGWFEATGRHMPGQGGPDRAGPAAPSYAARYSGSVSGGTMTLRIDVPELGQTLGPFRLRRGAESMLLRCL